jgi:putative DNA primase/helicase
VAATDKRKALEPILDKAEKLFALLGSDSPNESANALAKLKDILNKAGLDLLDLWQIGWNEKKDEVRALLAAMFADDVSVLVTIGQERASYFCNDAVCADVDVRGHRHTYVVESKAFAKWLLNEFFLEKKKAPASSAIKAAIRTLAAIAEFGPETPRYPIHLRTAEVDGRIYVDLCDEQSQCVEVDENGWRVVEAPPQVRFRHPSGMRSLPIPQRGGSIDMLRDFVNLNDSDFVLFVAVLLDAFRPGKHPILNLVGDFGAAKSTLAKIFKLLIDPDETELRSLPGTLRDIFIAVNNARVRAWDNVSKIERAISDGLCQLSDGSGFGTRRLYTDDDEFRVQGSRSIILTGLTNCVTRPDLNSRTVMLTLHPIKDEARKSETEFWTRFNEVYPLIFGALLDSVAHGLKQLPNVRLDNKSRMADFELFGHACEGAYAPAGSFGAALKANAIELNEELIENDPVAKAITAFMASMVKQTEWSGTTTELLVELNERDRTEQKVSRQKDWPPDATRFGGRVRAVAATLRKAGIEVTHGKAPDRVKTRTITLRKIIGRSDAADATNSKKKSRPKGKSKRLSKKANKKKQRPKRPSVRKAV